MVGTAGRTAVVWFRRDLRTADHPALLAAADAAAERHGQVAPLFVADGRLLRGAGANRRSFLAGCLAALDGSLDGSLSLRRGPSTAHGGRVRRRGRGRHRVRHRRLHTLRAAPGRRGGRRPGRRRPDVGACQVTLRGGPGPGADRRRLALPRVHPVPTWVVGSRLAPTAPAPRGVRWVRSDSDVTVDEIGAEPVSAALPVPGEAAATAHLEAFLAGPVASYDGDRDRPDRQGTSRLSPYLRFGCIHPRQVLARLGGGPGAQAFRSELAWREFYADVLWHHPSSAWESLSAVGAHLRWDSGPTADRRFDAWAAGATGFPLVDAGMRQLRSEGWMHNRVRMLTASFLVKDLHVDWRRGARLFLELLVDGDLASNNHGWQWVAGTGTDAAPFHRVFNPSLQAERFDPDGSYVARHVPDAGTTGYPRPIVDHAAERVEALDRWQEAKLALAGSAP